MHHLYREFQPHRSLEHVVECYWTVEATPRDGETAHDLVLPDGCIDILFDVLPESGGRSDAEPIAVGTMTRALSVATVRATQKMGVRFRPGAATPFVRAAAHELTDQSITLQSLWGTEAGVIWERLALAGGENERITILNRALTHRLDRACDQLDTAVLEASKRVEATEGRATVEALAELVGIGRRQLERRYRAAVGIGPKLSCSIARFRNVISILHHEPDIPLGQVAFRAGYADQPHMNRDFKRLAGVSPGAYRRSWETVSPPS